MCETGVCYTRDEQLPLTLGSITTKRVVNPTPLEPLHSYSTTAPAMPAPSTARYEPLELNDGPTADDSFDGRPVSGKPSNGPVGGGGASTRKRRDPLLGLAILVIVGCTLYLLFFSGPDTEEQLRFLQSQISHPTAANDVYKKPGSLQLDRNEYRPRWRRARWIPLEYIAQISSKGRLGLEKDLRLGDGFDLLEDIHQAWADPQRRTRDPAFDASFDYLRNRTVLLLGDGADRDSLVYACNNFFNGTDSVRRFTQPPIDLREPSLIDRRDPHVCTFPSHPAGPGFLEHTSVWSFMTFGILSTEETFEKMLFDVKPRRYLSRLEAIHNELERINVHPDFILLHSTLWDLQAINRENSRINLPPTEMLGLATLVEYRAKLKEALERVNEYWPKAKKVYRTLHTTWPDRGDWWMDEMPEGTQPFPRIPYAINKGTQLNAITSEVLTEMGIGKFDLKSVLSGYMDDYESSVHFGQIGRTLYAQMLMYYLKMEGTWF